HRFRALALAGAPVPRARSSHHIAVRTVANFGIGTLAMLPDAAVAQDGTGWPWPFDSPSVTAFARLEQHEVAALALILGVIFFAVVTSILLVRTRARAVRDRASARE